MFPVRTFIALVFSLSVSLPLFAQDDATKDEPTAATEPPANNMEIVREALQAEKKAFIAQNLGLSDTESDKFWPIYTSYQTELSTINTRTGKLIQDYADQYGKLDDPNAKKLMEEFLAIKGELNTLKKSYVSKFDDAIPTTKVARYYQLEQKIEAIINFDLAKHIPLAE